MKNLILMVSLLLLNSGTLMAANNQQVDTTSIPDSLMQVFQFEKAKEILYNLNRSAPGNSIVLYKLGQCHYNLGNYTDAAIYLNDSYKEDSTQSAVVIQLAVVNSKLGLYDKAVQGYQRLVQIDKENGYYHRLLANAYVTTKTPMEAIGHLLMAIELNDMDMEAYNMLAKLYFNAGDFEKAGEIAHTGLSKNARNTDLLFINARVAYLGKDYDKVLSLGDAALKVNADTSRWNLYLGYSSYFLKKYPECILWLNTAIQDKSINEQSYTYLANAYIKSDDPTKGLESLNKAIEIAKDNNLESNLQNKAILLHDADQDAEAIKLLEEAYHINKNPQVLFRLGQMHYNKKQYKSAKMYLESYQKSSDKLYIKEATELIGFLKKM
jgi:tetratricopeptide (TPR) repeat protein